MTAIEFIRRKNKITQLGLDIVLVPEDQIEEVKFMPLMYDVDDIEVDLSTNICPYCRVHHKALDEYNPCSGCPMDTAGNRCTGNGGNSTYSIVDSNWMDNATEEDAYELKALIDEYNEEEGR